MHIISHTYDAHIVHYWSNFLSYNLKVGYNLASLGFDISPGLGESKYVYFDDLIELFAELVVLKDHTISNTRTIVTIHT